MTSDSILSMTGYGEQVRDYARCRWRCVIQSVNSRYLDCRLRLPPQVAHCEAAIKSLLKKSLVRGKVDLLLAYEALIDPESTDSAGGELLDPVAVKNYCNFGMEAIRQLGWSTDEPLYRQGLLEFSLRQAVATKSALFFADDLPDFLLSLVSETLIRHRESCLQEGEQLLLFFTDALKDLGNRIAVVERFAATMPDIFRERLIRRISRMLDQDIELDQARLCQEVAYQVDKSDISEEIVRFRSHLQQLDEVLRSRDSFRKGKKLDFIVQELGREINTITAKANLLELTREAVEIKAILEQIREQVQNVA